MNNLEQQSINFELFSPAAMTAEHLTAYLQDESYLYTLNYEELKTLVMQYPYATNLRILLLKKSQFDDHKDYDRNLQMAASYTTNRRFLYKMTKRLKARKVLPQNVILGEEVLELTALSNIERLMVEKTVVQNFAEEKPKLAADWKLEFDNFEDELSQFSTKDEIKDPIDDIIYGSKAVQNGVKPARTEDDEIDELIQGIVLDVDKIESESTEPTAQVEENDLEIVASNGHTESFLDLSETNLVNLKLIKESDVDPEWLTIFAQNVVESTPSVSEPIEPILPTEFTNEREILSNLFKEMNLNDSKNQVSNENLELENEVDTESLEIENVFEIEHLELGNAIETESLAKSEAVTDLKTENWVKIEPQIEPIATPQYFEETKEEKPVIELEIVNKNRTTIVESSTQKEDDDAPKVSFTDWLRQFKMATPNTSLTITKIEESKPQVIDNQLDKKETIAQNGFKNSLEEVFETQDSLPENLFGWSDDQPSMSQQEMSDLIKNAFDTEGGQNSLEATTIIETQQNETTKNAETVVEPEEPKVKKIKKKKLMHELAAKSVILGDDIISETLANILAEQNNTDKAIEMYRRLALAFPEKSSYFAAKIETLNNRTPFVQ